MLLGLDTIYGDPALATAGDFGALDAPATAEVKCARPKRSRSGLLSQHEMASSATASVTIRGISN